MLQMTSVPAVWIILILIFGGGLIVSKLTERPRIPDVAAFLLLGIVLGPEVLGWIGEKSQSVPNQFILTLGAVLILFDGGRGVRFAILRKVWLTITLLATLGVVVTACITAAAAHYLLHIPWLVALLLATVIASTDPATLIPVFKRIQVKEKVQQTVESESAFNDATASILTFTVLSLLTTRASMVWWEPVLQFVQSSAIGVAVGLVVGILAVWLVSLKGIGIFHEYGSIVMLVAAMASYETSELLHGSGFMATFVTGVITGNAKSIGMSFKHHTETNIQHFGNVITLLLRMMIFVLLGSQVDFNVVGTYLVPGLIVIVVLMFIARPLTVAASALPDRIATWKSNEMLFMCWVRETGVIPAALAGMLLGSGAPQADMIAAITFIAILVTILLQATTTGFVAGQLGLLVADDEIEDI